LFPWAELTVDEETYDEQDEEQWEQECGVWDSELGGYVMHTKSLDDWRASRPTGLRRITMMAKLPIGASSSRSMTLVAHSCTSIAILKVQVATFDDEKETRVHAPRSRPLVDHGARPRARRRLSRPLRRRRLWAGRSRAGGRSLADKARYTRFAAPRSLSS
jgi:hypothetical protein